MLPAGGLLKGGGAVPKSATAASMEGYTLEGTKKPSFIPVSSTLQCKEAALPLQQLAGSSKVLLIHSCPLAWSHASN
jgi:hypothetical protein